jgi:TRAP-type C4-dicarboxylate transport system substrate-binding protein
MESPLMVGTLNAMGASATPMAYGELYTALQQGVMDGAENAPGNVLNDKFYEVSKYFSVTEHFAPPGVVAISNAAFSKLPDDLQKYLVKSAKELGETEMAADKEAQVKFLEELKSKGVAINTVDKAAFTKAVQPVIEKFSAEIGDDVMNLLK